MIHVMGGGYTFNDETGDIAKYEEIVSNISGIKRKIFTVMMNEGVGKVVTRSDIIMKTWGKSDETLFNASLTQQVYLLRKDLEKLGIINVIIAHSKAGYSIQLFTGPIEIVTSLKSSRGNTKYTGKIHMWMLLYSCFVSTLLLILTIIKFILIKTS